MPTISYADAMGAALERLQDIGFEHGPAFVNHAPMAAEALAELGHTDEVAAWVDHNLRTRDYHELPAAGWPLSAEESEWRAALGDFRRVGDWTALFERELAGEPWSAVLARWWPRLLPGISGALTHGVIRTAHAVRSIGAPGGDTPLQRTELARGLGYWAARYAGPRPGRGDGRLGREGGRPGPDDGGPVGSGSPERATVALDELVLDSAGFFARRRPDFPIPLIHAITAPAAVRLVADHLPPDQRWPSFLAARRCSDSIRAHFGGGGAAAAAADPDPAAAPSGAELVAAALELGDEHAIKLAEVAVRQSGVTPDRRCFAASQVATRLIRQRPV